MTLDSQTEMTKHNMQVSFESSKMDMTLIRLCTFDQIFI